MTMTKLTKSVRATIKDTIEKAGMPASPEMRAIATRVVRQTLAEDHGIVVRLKTLLKIAERVA
jgi:hypothetical protein